MSNRSQARRWFYHHAVADTASVIAAKVSGNTSAEAHNLIPFAGQAARGAMAGGVIKTLGEAIIACYEEVAG